MTAFQEAMTDQPDDDALLSAAQRDAAMFEAVFDRYLPAIHRYAVHRIGGPAADDVASETFAKAFEARMRARTVQGSLRAWLFAIATNLIRDELRRLQSARRADGRLRDDALTAHDAATAWSADPTGRLRTNPRLTAALLSLRDEEREALLLLAWGELGYAEIAVATGTVRNPRAPRTHGCPCLPATRRRPGPTVRGRRAHSPNR